MMAMYVCILLLLLHMLFIVLTVEACAIVAESTPHCTDTHSVHEQSQTEISDMT